MLVQAGLCRTCSETTLLVFPRGGSIIKINTDFEISSIFCLQIGDPKGKLAKQFLGKLSVQFRIITLHVELFSAAPFDRELKTTWTQYTLRRSSACARFSMHTRTFISIIFR